MTNLRDLFHKPAAHPIGGIDFTVHKLEFQQFDDALVVGTFLAGLDESFELEQLQQLKAGSTEREALERLLAGCLSLPVGTEGLGSDEPRRLQQPDVRVMPIVMLAEALAVVMEVNADFFFQTLPKLVTTGLRIRSTGLALLNRLSGQGTLPTGSATTASPS